MLHLLGRRLDGHCDGHSRRHFLKIGGLALGGLSLPQILQAQESSPASKGRSLSHKAVIMIYLSGGPSHQDMYDLKMEAPAEIRGSFRPIATNVPGIDICEHMPRLATMMDKFAIIRSLYGCPDQHASDLCLSGYPIGPKGRQDNHPSLGSAVSKLHGPVDPAVPPFVGLTIKTRHDPYCNPGMSGFLGQAHAPFQPEGEGMDDMRLKNVTLDQLRDRQALLNSFDRFRRHVDKLEPYREVDVLSRKAFDVLTSSRIVDALNLDNEEPAVRDRYGRGSADPAFGEDAGPHWMDQFLMARRLVEAGVRCVTLSFGSWDRHGGNFERLPVQLAKFDQGITALVEDLHQRGLDQDVSVVAWGEFGRTPRINAGGGRDHWPQVSCGLLAGGGMRMGQVIGSTNRLGEVPQDRPVHYQEVFATLYHRLGINVETATIPDHAGRPQYLVEHRDVIRELV
ncbi:MAG: DUF1501 domain-containing protein [Planctomycetaceae bacterium]|nr:DUF1501 domain-containing protein [Planctomycetaceae bacterium]